MSEFNLTQTMLSVLVNRMLSISDIIVKLTDEGYIPNRHKYNNLQLVDILYGAYSIIESFDDDTRKNFDKLYNSVLKS